MKYYKLYVMILAALLYTSCREVWGFVPTAYQCPADGAIVSTVGASGASYLSRQGQIAQQNWPRKRRPFCTPKP